MKIYTSYFGNVRHIPKNKKTFLVSIAGHSPNWFTDANNPMYKKIRALAPRYEWWNEWSHRFQNDLDSEASRAWYTRMYNQTVLSGKKPQDLIDLLRSVCQDDDAVFVLLCYETPERFCHRHIVADWFNSGGTGMIIEEYENKKEA